MTTYDKEPDDDDTLPGFIQEERFLVAEDDTAPVLLITAFADARLRARADELDTMVMSKPFPLAAFRAAVSLLLSLHPSRLGRRTSWRS